MQDTQQRYHSVCITVGSWSGQGWIVMDEETGAAGYMICGGLHNDTTIISGGSLSQAINNLIYLLLKILEVIKLFGIAGTIMSVAFAYIYAAILVLDALLPLLIILPFAFFFWAVGIALIYTSLLTLITLLEGMHAVRFIRRKEFAYA